MQKTALLGLRNNIDINLI